MSFQIPKQLTDLNSLQFTLLLPVTVNDIDVDRMMPALMELCVKSGRVRPSRTDVSGFEGYLDLLIDDPTISGLSRQHRRSVLDGWIRASVLKLGRAGKNRSRPKMDFPRPVTLATYRSGLPKGRSRNRSADKLVYRSMLDHLAGRAETRGPQISALAGAAFGRGLDLGGVLDDEPRYDGNTEIDVSALLALKFFDHFEERGAPSLVKTDDLQFAVPGAIVPMGADAVDLLTFYGETLPPIEGASRLAALLSLRLFQLPLRTAVATRELIVTGTCPTDMLSGAGSNPLEIYCDFTLAGGSSSDELSRWCVQRDLELMRQSLSDRLRLRSLNQAMDVAFPGLSGRNLPLAERMSELVKVQNEPEMAMALRMQVQQIEAALREAPDGVEGIEFINDLRRSGVDGADLITQVLVEALAPKRGLENQVKWFWSTGGINKSYGILRGRQAVRSSWRYCPSDDLLVSMLLVAFVDPSGGRTSKELPVETVLRRLRQRFGVCIAEPPKDLVSAAARAGASANRDAFIRRLQLLGCFEGLSDDFSAQFVSRPREASA